MRKKKLKIYDFEDMILEVLAALQENKNFLLDVAITQERYNDLATQKQNGVRSG